jgi:hypothetical protein
MFGLKCCNRHYDAARRDCRAYMHREGLVRLKDMMEFTCFNNFIRYVDALPDGICVRRSSGELQKGWKVSMDEFGSTRFLSYMKDATGKSDWCIYLVYDNLCKYVQLRQYTYENIPEILKVLNGGVYKKDEEEYQIALNQDAPKEVEEAEGVYTVIHNGAVGRIFIPGDTDKPVEAPPTDPAP